MDASGLRSASARIDLYRTDDEMQFAVQNVRFKREPEYVGANTAGYGFHQRDVLDGVERFPRSDLGRSSQRCCSAGVNRCYRSIRFRLSGICRKDTGCMSESEPMDCFSNKPVRTFSRREWRISTFPSMVSGTCTNRYGGKENLLNCSAL